MTSLGNLDKHSNKVIFYTDCQSVLLALDNCFTKKKQVWETMQNLNEVSKRVQSVSIKWVQGHAGHLGNEMADLLANRGLSEQFQEDSPNISIKVLNNCIRQGMLQSWNKEWIQEENHKKTRTRQTRQFFPFLRPDFSFEVLQLRRNMFSLVVQICTGHN